MQPEQISQLTLTSQQLFRSNPEEDNSLHHVLKKAKRFAPQEYASPKYHFLLWNNFFCVLRQGAVSRIHKDFHQCQTGSHGTRHSSFEQNPINVAVVSEKICVNGSVEFYHNSRLFRAFYSSEIQNTNNNNNKIQASH